MDELKNLVKAILPDIKDFLSQENTCKTLQKGLDFNVNPSIHWVKENKSND